MIDKGEKKVDIEITIMGSVTYEVLFQIFAILM